MITGFLHSFSENTPISVNWHLCSKCNYKCLFCFGRFTTVTRRLTKKQALIVIRILANIGTKKLTFTGGEPLLCLYLGDLLVEAKSLNITTMIVSNGSFINESYLQKYHSYVDWIGLSIDSAYEETEMLLGRGNGYHVQNIRKVVKIIKRFNIKLKINIVVTSLNYQEDMSELINELDPDRIKIFQVLKIQGENDVNVEDLLITQKQFLEFVERHREFNPTYETNELMQGSYIMLDPLGRFFQNSKGYIEYSRSILEVDPLEALAEVGWDREKFLKRGGIYEW